MEESAAGEDPAAAANPAKANARWTRILSLCLMPKEKNSVPSTTREKDMLQRKQKLEWLYTRKHKLVYTINDNIYLTKIYLTNPLQIFIKLLT